MKADLYGRTVRLPDIVGLPLRESDGALIDLDVSIGALKDCDASFELDDAVRIHVGQGKASVEPRGELGPRALEHYLVDHAVPNGLMHNGDMVVHCAGLVRNERAIVLLGDSGQGKSTLSLHLCGAGWTLLGDDSVRLERDGGAVYAWPSYSGLRLHRDMMDAATPHSEVAPLVAEYADKRRLFLPGAAPTAKLGLLVVLGNNADFDVVPIGPAERCAALANQAFFTPGHISEAMSRLDKVLPIARDITGIRIDYTRTTSGATSVVECLNRWAEGDRQWQSSP